MSDCCSTIPPGENFKTHRCPLNGKPYARVSSKTLLHQVNKPWQSVNEEQAFYFCDDPDCEVVYFSRDGSMIMQGDVRDEVGIKSANKTSPLCYCFGISYADAERDPGTMAFVRQQTRNKICECEARNPSGKCCLKDFPRQTRS